MRLVLDIALKQLLARKRQGFVSLLGIILGVAFFLAVASLMIGSEADFIKRLVDNAPHISIVDEFRNSSVQAVNKIHPNALIKINNATPISENRGIRNYRKIIALLKKDSDTKASASLVGQALVNFAGRDYSVTLNGMVADEIQEVTTIESQMLEGSVKDLVAYPDGIVIGDGLARKLNLEMGDLISITSSIGLSRNFKILGIFRTGRSSFDDTQVFLHLVRAQALLNRIRRANRVIVKLKNPYQARELATEIETLFAYKSISWQEASEDIINTLVIRNTIMYTVVSAVLIVAAFGIYNVISTVVKEKYRDIAILCSMGFSSTDIKGIFIIQGLVLGIIGCLLGVPLGCLFMYALMQVKFKPPGSSEVVSMPIDWGSTQFIIASLFAVCASLLAAYLPARQAGKIRPVTILRGGW